MGGVMESGLCKLCLGVVIVAVAATITVFLIQKRCE